MLLWENIKDVETFLSPGLLTRHCVDSQNCDLSARNNTGKANTLVPISAITAVLPTRGFGGSWYVLTTLLSPRRPQSRGRHNCQGQQGSLHPAGPGLAKAGLWHRQEQARGGGEAPTGNRGFPELQCLCWCSACPHSGISKRVQTLCLLGEPPTWS